MKYYETHFTDYIKANEEYNLHTYYKNFNEDVTFNDLKHYIFYGPTGIGKYTQALRFIRKYSDSSLSYVKKVPISVHNKSDFIIKISDVHFEIDMDLLGCNARTLWHDIYNQIVDIVMASHTKKGIILCKNFDQIHPELLDIFYCYMNNACKKIKIKYILLTSNLSFIPRNLLQNTEIITFSRPELTCYKKTINNNLSRKLTKEEKELCNKLNTDSITNIKHLYSLSDQTVTHKNICDEIYKIIIQNHVDMDLFELREKLYNILLYHHDVYECFYYILEKLYKARLVKKHDLLDINVKVVELAKLYNNNYRPIFHLERFSLYLSSKVNQNYDELQDSN